MTTEHIVLLIIWIISIVGSIVVLRIKSKRKEAIVAFFSCQAITWINTLLHVEFKLVTFPVREFPKATDILFTTEFLLYPFICAIYFISEKEQSSLFIRTAYIVVWAAGVTLIDVVLERHTNLIVYLHYHWYWKFLDFFVLLILTRAYSRWFVKRMNRREQA